MPGFKIHEIKKEVKDMSTEADKPIEDIQCGNTTQEQAQAAEGDDPIAALQAQLKAAEQKRDEYLEMAQRIQAEFENYKKRNRSAVQDACQTAADETILAFLPVLDNLERARKAAEDVSDIQDIVTGVEMVIKQFNDLLAQMDVTAIDAIGQPFDPAYHHAVMQEEAEDAEKADTVVAEIMKGYMRNDKVIRYSMVKVAN